MVAVLDKTEAFVQVGVTWEQFKAIQQGFESIPNVRLNYCEGELEILGISKTHEALRCILALLLGAYFEEMSIEFFPSGAYSQVVERVTEYQSDLSYCFDTDKDRPDLAIEIVITSGSTKKLQKYRLKEVPEVWFWQKGNFTLYRLRDGEYVQISQSQALERIDLSLLSQCMMLDSRLEAVKRFRNSLQK